MPDVCNPALSCSVPLVNGDWESTLLRHPQYPLIPSSALLEPPKNATPQAVGVFNFQEALGAVGFGSRGVTCKERCRRSQIIISLAPHSPER